MSNKEIAEEERLKFERLEERAKRHFESGDKAQALSANIEAIKALSLCRIFELAAMRTEGQSPNISFAYSDEDKVYFTTNIGMRLLEVTTCKTGDDIVDMSIEIYCVEKIKEICEELKKYQEIFDEKAEDNFNIFCSYVDGRERFFLEQQIKHPNLFNEGENQYTEALEEALSVAYLSDISVMKSEKSSSSSCFIATAAYSTSIHPDLDTFRSFRDEKLLPHLLGAKLVNLYYKISPSLASYIAQQPTIKIFLKHHLSRLAHWIRHYYL